MPARPPRGAQGHGAPPRWSHGVDRCFSLSRGSLPLPLVLFFSIHAMGPMWVPLKACFFRVVSDGIII